MVRHQPYFDTLAGAEKDSASWSSALAGLAVLRLADAARDDNSIIDSDWTGVRAVAETVTALREGNPVRRPLMKVVEQLRDDARDWPAITAAIFAYGRMLDLEGHWSHAADVFGVVADIARADRNPELAIEATTALGGAARRSGDWDRSAEGYAEAAHLADALGDRASGLTVRVGTANTQLARGNLQAAQSILDEVIAEATTHELDGVAALALHTGASIAHSGGRFNDAVRLGYRALEKTVNPSARDGILEDIAANFAELGMNEAARDAHLIVMVTSRLQWVRWQAEINLMELASRDGQAVAFDHYAGELRDVALDPRLRSWFLVNYGIGCLSFGREEEGLKALNDAQRFATQHEIHLVAFEAEKSMSAHAAKRKSDSAQTTKAASWSDPIPEDVRQVATALTQLRETALSSSPAGDLKQPGPTNQPVQTWEPPVT